MGAKPSELLTSSNEPIEHLKSLFIRICSMIIELILRTLKPLIMGITESGLRRNCSFLIFLGAAGMRQIKQTVTYLSTVLATFQQYFVPVNLVKAIFQQIFLNMEVTLFNEIILRRDMCSWSQGMELKMKISAIEDWTRVCN
jgi:hypothetical protein